MTWQGYVAWVSDMAQHQPSLRAEFQVSCHVTSQAKPHATSICHVISIHVMHTLASTSPNTPPPQVFFPSLLLPLPIPQFHFPTLEILKSGTIYQKTSQKFSCTNLWISNKQSLTNVPKINNQYIVDIW